MAGVTQADISTLMIYDNFTPTVLFSLEGYGYCGAGESGPFVAEGDLSLGARYRTIPRAAISPNPTCRGGPSILRPCSKCAAHAARVR